MNREEALTKVAMDLPKWSESVDEAFGLYRSGFAFIGSVKSLVMLHHLDTQHPIIEEEYLKRRKEIINEPDDADAPEWANWKAQDENGMWWWYGKKPRATSSGHWTNNAGENLADTAACGETPAGHRWRDTLKPVNQQTEAPQWGGETWPPPVGSIVGIGPGEQAEVVAVRDNLAVVYSWPVSDVMSEGELEPIPSAEDKAVEAIQEAMVNRDKGETMNVAIYRAIAAGEIPGVILENTNELKN